MIQAHQDLSDLSQPIVLNTCTGLNCVTALEFDRLQYVSFAFTVS